MSESNQAETILNTGKQLAGILPVSVNGTTAPVIFDGKGNPIVISLDQVEKWLAHPVRKRGQFIFADADSFCRYFNQHKDPDSRIFAAANELEPSFRGVLNFHGTDPGFNDHVCIFSLQPTHEWSVWMGHCGHRFTQADFAAFLETNQDMFASPNGADLLELVQTLEGKSEASVKSAVRLNNGQLNVTISEEVTLRGGSTTNQDALIELPLILEVSVMPFHGTGIYPMKARLRWRIADRKITFWYETINSRVLVRQVASDVLMQIEKQTGIEPFKV